MEKEGESIETQLAAELTPSPCGKTQSSVEFECLNLLSSLEMMYSGDLPNVPLASHQLRRKIPREIDAKVLGWILVES